MKVHDHNQSSWCSVAKPAMPGGACTLCKQPALQWILTQLPRPSSRVTVAVSGSAGGALLGGRRVGACFNGRLRPQPPSLHRGVRTSKHLLKRVMCVSQHALSGATPAAAAAPVETSTLDCRAGKQVAEKGANSCCCADFQLAAGRNQLQGSKAIVPITRVKGLCEWRPVDSFPSTHCRRTVQPMQPAGAGLPRATMPKLEELRHPLLGDAPTLQLMPPPTDVPGACHAMSVCNDATKGACIWRCLRRQGSL